MKDIKTILTESRTQPKEIKDYVKSWLKQPDNEREMNEVLEAIVEGMNAALDYRTDDGYMDNNRQEYNKASDVLETFIGKIE